MKNKNVFLIEEKILKEIEDLGDNQILSFFSNHEVYQMKESCDEDSLFPLMIQASFKKDVPLEEMLYHVRFSDPSKVCVITADQEKVYEAQMLGIDTCFYNTGYNDYCSLEASCEITTPKQLLKVMN